MTTFAEMQTLVESQTRRPEIPAVTQAAIRAATLRAHHTDFFPRDLANTFVTYTPSSSASYYDLPTISATVTRLRTFQWVQSTELITHVPQENLDYREISDLYTSDNVLRSSMYTILGDTLRIYPQIATGELSICYYQNPSISSTAYSSWIADTYPDELAMWAAGIVYARTGFAEMANDAYKNHIQPFKELLLASHLLQAVN